MTSTRSCGGKSPGPAGPRGVLEAGQAVPGEPLPPLADGVPVAAEFRGDGLIGGSVGVGGPENDAAAEDQGLWGGPGPDEGFEVPADVGGEVEPGAEGEGHGSLRAEREGLRHDAIMAGRDAVVQLRRS